MGAILISFRMIPRFGLVDGSFKAVFLAVSAFCNAGFDTLGSVSLQEYVHDPLMCLTIMALIVLGGLGFAVWFDIRDKVGPLLHRRITFKKFRHSLSLHTKIVLSVSLFLIIIPGLLIMLVEFTNSRTLGDFNIFEKLMTAMFESIALRTAGFTTINYAGLKPATDLLMMVVMFYRWFSGRYGRWYQNDDDCGACHLYYLLFEGREHTVVLHRKNRKRNHHSSNGNFFINLVVLFTGIFLLNIVEQKPFLSLSFEAVSAMATVGSSLGITTSLGVGGKLIIIFLMYVGRIGISTLILSLTRNKPNRNSANKVSFPNGNIIVG